MPGTHLDYDFARFLHVRRACAPSFSPDGRRIAFISDLVGHLQAYTMPVEGGWPRRVTFAADRVGLAAYSPTDDLLIVAADRDGDERVQLTILTADGAVARPITARPDAIHRFGGWSPDGRLIAYASNARDARHFDVYVCDVASGEARLIWQTSGDHHVQTWSPDGQRLIVSRVTSSAENDLYEIDLATSATRHLTPHAGWARFLCPAYSADGQSLYLICDRDADTLGIARLDLGTLDLTPLVQTAWGVEDLALSPDRRSIAYATNVDGYSDLHVRELQTGLTRAVEMPRGVIGRSFVGSLNDALTWSPDGTKLACSLTTARETQNVWIADVGEATGDRPIPAIQLTAADQAGIPPDTLAEPTLVHYPTFDGLAIPAFLYVPDAAEPDGERSAIVLIHGGPESQIHPDFNATVQYFVHRGYVVLTPNVRGSTGYGKAYSHLDDVERRLDSVADAKAAAEWLGASGWAHPRRIAAMGQSYGGFMVLASLCFYPETWAAGVDLYGIANFVTLLERTHPFRRKLREHEYGSLETDREFLAQVSPLNHVERIIAPLLVVHGENDLRVPIGESEQIVAALEARGVPVEMIRLADEGHAISSLKSQLRVFPAIAEFLERHIGRR